MLQMQYYVKMKRNDFLSIDKGRFKKICHFTIAVDFYEVAKQVYHFIWNVHACNACIIMSNTYVYGLHSKMSNHVFKKSTFLTTST